MINLVRKVARYGIKQSVKISIQKVQYTTHHSYWRLLNRFDRTSHHWQYLVTQHKLDSNFHIFFESSTLKSISFLDTLYIDHISDMQIIKDADFCSAGGIDVLGSGVQYHKNIPWHTDIRLQQQNLQGDCTFDPTVFYADITVPHTIDHMITSALQKDIKVPWELSRCYQLYVLGKAYILTQDQKYVDRFVQTVTDWLDHNVYLRGVNWVCPMEVAIRALNWVCAFHFFKDAFISKDFWQRFICSLYDHLIFLEHNWELYDGRTSNHYLANLVGYWYLCWFFGGLTGFEKKRAWCLQEILRECEKQFFVDGTDYEGSTAYHRLKTEMIYLFYMLAREQNIILPDWFIKRLDGTIQFVHWCSYAQGALIKIGDDDAGKMLHYGLPITALVKNDMQKKKEEVAYFPSFGLSIIKKDSVHITLRHHAYTTCQPSGHFHNDALSITLAIDGVPIFIDPGSYVYTASAYWRNYFRSMCIHNTIHINDQESARFDNRLFTLNILKNTTIEKPYIHGDTMRLKASHYLYIHYLTRMQRQVLYRKRNVQLIDTIEVVVDDGIVQEHNTIGWNFTLAPRITPQIKENGVMLMYANKSFLFVTCEQLQFTVHEQWYAPSYGTKEKIWCIRAHTILQKHNVIIIDMHVID